MAKFCKCCGKKAGLGGLYMLTDEEGICSKCYSAIEQLNELEDASETEQVDRLGGQLAEAVKNADYSEDGRQFVLDYVEQRKNVKLEKIRKRREREQEIEHASRLKIEKEEKEKTQYEENVKSCKLTTGYNFEGYRIVSYLDIVSGGTVLGTGFLTEITASFSDLLGTSSGMFSDKLEKAREIAKKELVSSAAKAGGNAVIGVDFDYISFPGNMIGVVASGTAVVIE